MKSTESPATTRTIVSGVVTAIESEVIRVTGGYVKIARRIILTAGAIIAVLGAFIAGLGNAMSKSFGYGGDKSDTVAGGEIVLASGVIIAITGLLIIFAPVILKKLIKK